MLLIRHDEKRSVPQPAEAPRHPRRPLRLKGNMTAIAAGAAARLVGGGGSLDQQAAVRPRGRCRRIVASITHTKLIDLGAPECAPRTSTAGPFHCHDFRADASAVSPRPRGEKLWLGSGLGNRYSSSPSGSGLILTSNRGLILDSAQAAWPLPCVQHREIACDRLGFGAELQSPFHA
jgi:hypothetical protein